MKREGAARPAFNGTIVPARGQLRPTTDDPRHARGYARKTVPAHRRGVSRGEIRSGHLSRYGRAWVLADASPTMERRASTCPMASRARVRARRLPIRSMLSVQSSLVMFDLAMRRKPAGKVSAETRTGEWNRMFWVTEPESGSTPAEDDEGDRVYGGFRLSVQNVILLAIAMSSCLGETSASAAS